jgi:hypothetical protein
MQSSMVSLAWMLSAIPRKHFDTSGKSAALLHHHAICKTRPAPRGDVIASASEAIHGAAQRKNGLLRRLRSSQ